MSHLEMVPPKKNDFLRSIVVMVMAVLGCVSFVFSILAGMIIMNKH